MNKILNEGIALKIAINDDYKSRRLSLKILDYIKQDKKHDILHDLIECYLAVNKSLPEMFVTLTEIDEEEFKNIIYDFVAGLNSDPNGKNSSELVFMATAITAAEAERKYNLTKGTIRQDIRRRRFKEYEYKKSGNNWLVSPQAVERVYKKSK